MEQSQKEQWAAGQIGFGELLRRDNTLTHYSLAVELGIRIPHCVVSVRSVYYSEWPDDDQLRIMMARDAYTAGTVELATGRYKNHFILYSIPRKKSTKPREWFQCEGEY